MYLARDWIRVDLEKGEIVVGVLKGGRRYYPHVYRFKKGRRVKSLELLARLARGERVVYEPSMSEMTSWIKTVLKKFREDTGVDFDLDSYRSPEKLFISLTEYPPEKAV